MMDFKPVLDCCYSCLFKSCRKMKIGGTWWENRNGSMAKKYSRHLARKEANQSTESQCYMEYNAHVEVLTSRVRKKQRHMDG